MPGSVSVSPTSVTLQAALGETTKLVADVRDGWRESTNWRTGAPISEWYDMRDSATAGLRALAAGQQLEQSDSGFHRFVGIRMMTIAIRRRAQEQCS